MKIISQQEIMNLCISPAQSLEWITQSFKMKYNCILPQKTSVKPFDYVFYNSMPCYIPSPVNKYGIKIVSRYPEMKPSLNADYLLYDGESGKLLALMDANWITTMRTGAVATLTIHLFKASDASVYSFVGLGNTACAVMQCLLETSPDEMFHVRIMAHKGQEIDFINRFSGYSNVSFEVVDNHRDLIVESDVIVSCVTVMNGLFATDDAYKEGCLVVPVHTRGFQNCDLFFDKVFVDDTMHVSDFSNFSHFKSLGELSNVLLGNIPGRDNDRQRILAYNIGIGLHDLYFADKIYGMTADTAMEYDYSKINGTCRI